MELIRWAVKGGHMHSVAANAVHRVKVKLVVFTLKTVSRLLLTAIVVYTQASTADARCGMQDQPDCVQPTYWYPLYCQSNRARGGLQSHHC